MRFNFIYLAKLNDFSYKTTKFFIFFKIIKKNKNHDL